MSLCHAFIDYKYNKDRMNERRIRLVCGDLSAEVAPENGGALAWFRAGDHPLLRPELTAGAYAGRALGMACFPMVPFANRIAGGRFRHASREYRVACNVPELHPLHGHGWQSAWTVRDRGSSSATLEFRGGAEWPWPYLALETFTLEPDALVITLEMYNLADEPVPASLGLHPYFSHSGSMRLEGSALVVWDRDAAGIPSGVRHLPPAGPCNLPHRIAQAGLDHCYDGWTGRARIRWLADRTVLRMETQGSRCLHVYAPSAQDYVCLEPVSARPDAFNPRPDDLSPVPIMAPRGSLRLGMRLRVESWPVSAPHEVAPPQPPA
jgi:aldose 1-epimerase